ncbi:MAG: electron transport complex subunit RsxC [Halanaerobiaceae bacterium]
MRALTFKQGVHPEYHKNLTRKKSLQQARRPERVAVSLQQHIGAPCKPLVEKGDHVDPGKKIGDTESFVSAPVHAPISGTVAEITGIVNPNGSRSQAVVIEADEEDGELVKLTAGSNPDEMTADELRKIIREAGITGMGGAMFPTHVKLSVPEDKNVEYLIINGAECEPYLTVDERLMIERPDNILQGMKFLMRALEVKKGIIGIEDNKPEAIAEMQKVVSGEKNITVQVLEAKYPQGGEKMLIKALLDREVPEEGLPLDVGVVVNNVSTAAAVKDAVVEGKPLLERAVSITGKGISNPCNLICKIGTSVGELIEQAGGFSGRSGKIVLGGPMMGVAQKDLQVPIVKGTSGILVIPEGEVGDHEPLPCIGCSRCVDSCPMLLQPVRLANLSKQEDYEKLEKNKVLSCVECGSCSYICPAKRPLLHYIKMGKGEVMARRKNS